MTGRLWFYSNYHCNLECRYCLTESAPRSERRVLDPKAVVGIADEANDLGFTGFGVTGGEPFLLPYLPDLLLELGKRLPTVVLSNGTLFTDRLVQRMRPITDYPIAVQISLDSADPIENDTMRGPENFAKVVKAIPKLRDIGIPVRIATTGDDIDRDDLAKLCALHRSLGVSDDDHVVRPIVRRGRAVTNELGVDAVAADLPAELTITADGAFYSPFGPTVLNGRLDTDLLITRTIRPLTVPAAALNRFLEGRPPGQSSALKIT